MMNYISNKPCQHRNTDYWVDDTLVGNIGHTRHRTKTSKMKKTTQRPKDTEGVIIICNTTSESDNHLGF
jgi:hypothetical protein